MPSLPYYFEGTSSVAAVGKQKDQSWVSVQQLKLCLPHSNPHTQTGWKLATRQWKEFHMWTSNCRIKRAV